MKMMKEKMMMLASLLMGFAVSVTMISCGGDDGNGDGPSGGSGKRLVKITESSNGKTDSNIYTTEFTYDPQGRITKLVIKKNGGLYAETAYIYSETLIVRNRISYSNGSQSSTSTHKFSLENGRVVKDAGSHATYTFTYDSNGYLRTGTEISSPGSDSETTDYVWENGNLVKIGQRTYEYGNLAWCNIGFEFSGPDMEPALQMTGFYGRMPKNMPTKYYGSKIKEFKYGVSGGLITSITYEDGDVVSFEWN
jgi:hypothetical protein